MAVWAEMAFLQAQGNEQKHQHAHKHVKAVKTRQHKEGGTVNSGTKLQIERRISMEVLIALNQQESNAQEHRQPHKANGFAAIAINQGMVCDG